MENDLVTLKQYNEVFRKVDETFHKAAKSFNMSDSAFWILYNLRDIGPELTQREVYRNSCMPKQTVNSALKRLYADGYIEFRAIPDINNCYVCLTQKGEELMVNTIDRVMDVERQTMRAMPEEEFNKFIELTCKYMNLLTNNILTMMDKQNNIKTIDGE